MILEDIRKSISNQIQDVQIKKQKLFDEISKFDSELLNLNETLVKINDDDAFLKISPNDAFLILEKLGYHNKDEIIDLYIDIISGHNKNNISKCIDCDDYIEELDVNTKDSYKVNMLKRKQIKKIMLILDEYFKNDDCYYYINNIKLSKFRIFYNMLNLLENKIDEEKTMRVIKTAFCYKNVLKDERDIVLKEIDNVNINLSKIYKEIKIIRG